MVKALQDFGLLGLTAADLQIRDQVIQLGYPPDRIDLISTPDGVDFETCYDARMTVVVDDVDVHFIDLENLRKNKRASGRIQDIADHEHLCRARRRRTNTVN